MSYSRLAKHRYCKIVIIAMALALPGTTLDARDKTDIVHLKNGDRLTGEIKKLTRGRLSLKTDALGTVSIEWDEISLLKSEDLFEIENESGERYFGLIQPTTEEGMLEVEELAGTATLEKARVVEITPIEETFWQRLEGSVDLGFDYTQANTAIQWTFSADSKYRAEDYQVKVDYSSRFQEQQGSTTINRNALTGDVQWFLVDRWFLAGLSQFFQSEEQSVDFRTVLGGGVGRYLLQSNRTLLSLGGGLVANIEKFTDNETFDQDLEALVTVSFDKFLFDDPQLDIATTFALLPSLMNPGRVRLDLRSKLRIEFIKDLYWSVDLFETFDSDPPAIAARRNDFGITTSLGWSF